MSDAPRLISARPALARALARGPVIVAGAIVAGAALLTACGSHATPQPTVTVTVPGGGGGSTPATTPGGGGSSAPTGSEPGIVAVTSAGALVVLDPANGSITQTLVSSGVLGDEISVSPDGSTVYFAAGHGCTPKIESVSVSGGTPTVITQGALPAISPDGTKLAFASQPPLIAGCSPSPSNFASSFKLVIRTLSSGAEQLLPLAPGQVSSGLPSPISHLSWASDNTRLAVSVSAIQDNEGWAVNIIDTSVAKYYTPPGPNSGVLTVPVTGLPAPTRSYLREGVFLPDGDLFISRACCGGFPVRNTSRLMWEVGVGGAFVHQVAIGYVSLDHNSLAADPSGHWLLYLAGGTLYVSQNGNRPTNETTGLIAATWR
jgi:hypothetical protein